MPGTQRQLERASSVLARWAKKTDPLGKNCHRRKIRHLGLLWPAGHLGETVSPCIDRQGEAVPRELLAEFRRWEQSLSPTSPPRMRVFNKAQAREPRIANCSIVTAVAASPLRAKPSLLRSRVHRGFAKRTPTRRAAAINRKRCVWYFSYENN